MSKFHAGACLRRTFEFAPPVQRVRRWLRRVAAALWCGTGLAAQYAVAADTEMGTGVPFFGFYSQATGVQTNVWGLSNQTLPFPAGCPYIVLTAATMGMDAYKIAVATLLLANTTNRTVRFYAHGPRDGGCGVDYVQLN